MHCAFCRSPLGYVHGHAACLDGRCPMFGQNQAECCSGDTGDCLPTSAVAGGPVGAPVVTAASTRPAQRSRR
ncbi:MAG TPA: hypothetical protein VH062_32495 [Polyangiaceae bacterium]|nr:hypothetical protein [Polyangiaceae bacterium]